MIDSDMNWVIFPSYPQQKYEFICGFLFIWFVQAIVEKIGFLRENLVEFIIVNVEMDNLGRKQKELLL